MPKNSPPQVQISLSRPSSFENALLHHDDQSEDVLSPKKREASSSPLSESSIQWSPIGRKRSLREFLENKKKDKKAKEEGFIDDKFS